MSDQTHPRQNWWIVGLLSASMAVNLVDRQVLSVVAPILRAQLFLSNTQYSYIILAFQVGMLLGQVPAGLLLDMLGARLGFIIIFIFWSTVNAITALSRGLAGLIGLRFLLGLAECGNFSGGVKVIARLFTTENRAEAGGYFNGGAQIGAVLAPPIVVFIVLHWGWRSAFVLPSVLGLLWLFPWIRLYPPEGKKATPAPAVTSQVPPEGKHVPVKALFRNRQMLGLMIIRGTGGPLTSFYWYWLPEYLLHGRGMSLVMIGAFAWLPYLAGASGNVMGGYCSDKLIKRGMSLDVSRKASFVAGGVFTMLSSTLPFIPSAPLAVAVICLVVLGNQWMTAIYIALVGDIFPSEIAATVNGLGGLADSSAVMVTMLLTGIIVDHFSYFPVLITAGILPVLAMLSLFVVIRKVARVEMRGLTSGPAPIAS